MKPITLLFLCALSTTLLQAQTPAPETDPNRSCRGQERVACSFPDAAACRTPQSRAMPVSVTADIKKGEFVPARSDVTLSDGSMIRCAIHDKNLPFTTAFGQKVEIHLDVIDKIEAGAGNTNVVLFRNGDRLTGLVDVEHLKIETAFGPQTLPLSLVQSIQIKNPNVKADGLVYWNTFDSPSDSRQPKVGEATNIQRATFIQGVKGNAIHTGGNTDVVSFRIPTQTLQTKGCIEFWGKIDPESDTFGTGSNPRFFWLSRTDGGGGVRLEFSSNNGVGAGGLTCLFNNVSCGTSSHGPKMSYRTLLGDAYTDWNHYALVWNRDGVNTGTSKNPVVAIYVNGKLANGFMHAPNPLNILYFPDEEHMFLIASYRDTVVSRLPFAIDELKIWNYDKTTFGLE